MQTDGNRGQHSGACTPYVVPTDQIILPVRVPVVTLEQQLPGHVAVAALDERQPKRPPGWMQIVHYRFGRVHLDKVAARILHVNLPKRVTFSEEIFLIQPSCPELQLHIGVAVGYLLRVAVHDPLFRLAASLHNWLVPRPTARLESMMGDARWMAHDG